MLRVLHTSDWHLGHNLFHQDRRYEHSQFLDWLLALLTTHQIDALIIAGDIFDTVAPSNYALTLYYDFLRRLVSDTSCRQAVIIGGNHDSAASLHAPRELLKVFNVHVVGSPDLEQPANDLILLHDPDGNPCGMVAAVPFLRERDMRRAHAGESYADKNRAYLQGVAAHYAQACSLARERIAQLSGRADGLPLIATGHLFAAGGEVSDGEREVSVGTLGGISAFSIAAGFDYLALGHLHKPQTVAGPDPIRYSGSPIPLSFSEAGSKKTVTLLHFDDRMKSPDITEIPVPLWQPMKILRGDWPVIETFFAGRDGTEDLLWLEIQLETDILGAGVQERVAELAAGKACDVLATRNYQRLLPRLMDGGDESTELLSVLTPQEVFARRLDLVEELTGEEREAVVARYRQVVDAATVAMEGAVDED
ncbi:MAG: exonuclease SbcCD subunit D C-terminal domain-containing protein [Proteobacteria bacterium]|nr:exonuclease subunit SbcD [Desulfobulbaceae bacterium]MBU4152584.1 exonuclease SbcCD subunit D C-terminal domain-containing protein [Pseudomonadota bacterium]